jgi:hypothetical protein
MTISATHKAVQGCLNPIHQGRIPTGVSRSYPLEAA